MKDIGITFETAKLAKEKGFTLGTVGSHTYTYYQDDGRLGPVDWGHLNQDSPAFVPQSILQKWLREEHNIAIIIIPCYWGEFDTRNGMWEVKLYFLDNVEHKGTKEHDYNDVGYETKFLECDDPESKDWLMHDIYDNYELALDDALVYGLKRVRIKEKV